MTSGLSLFDPKKDGHSDDLVKAILKPHKTVRDAVHGDIMLTKLEVEIIDTECFQRLRGIRQLGTAHLVYPCAMHTRFDHAIGCLHVADALINQVNNNPFADHIIDDYDRFMIRLCALLHDLAHIPFGHTLEDEGGLLEGQWKDKERAKKFLGDGSEVARIINTNTELIKLHESGRSEYQSKNVLKDLRELITAIEDHTVDNLPRPYMGDIIGNTLCADLLDYIRRDLYFAGLDEKYDERFLSYLYVTNHNHKLRLVLRLHKPSTKRIRRDVLSELLHLLRLRYSLAEKVYFHHAKISSSAMLISAVTDMLQAKKLRADQLYAISDDGLVDHLLKNGTEATRRLIKNIRTHSLYKPVYGLKFGGKRGEDTRYKVKFSIREDMGKKELRWNAERSIEKANSLPSGSVVIYCPNEGMGAKAVEALVDLGDGNIGRLAKIAPQRVQDEIRTSITQKHEELWRMYVFVDRNISDDQMKNVHGDCARMFRIESDLEECEQFRYPEHLDYRVRYEERYVKENPKAERLDDGSAQSIAARSGQPPSSNDLAKYIWSSYKEYCDIRYLDEKK